MRQGMGRSWGREIPVCEEVLLVGGVFCSGRAKRDFSTTQTDTFAPSAGSGQAGAKVKRRSARSASVQHAAGRRNDRVV
jgi:hypothetical protein